MGTYKIKISNNTMDQSPIRWEGNKVVVDTCEDGEFEFFPSNGIEFKNLSSSPDADGCYSIQIEEGNIIERPITVLVKKEYKDYSVQPGFQIVDIYDSTRPVPLSHEFGMFFVGSENYRNGRMSALTFGAKESGFYLQFDGKTFTVKV